MAGKKSRKGIPKPEGRASQKWACDVDTLSELVPYLCDAAFTKKGHQKPVLRPENCAACDGCSYGRKYVRILRAQGWDPTKPAEEQTSTRKAEETKKMEAMAKEIKRLEAAKEKAEKKAALLESKMEAAQLDWQRSIEEQAETGKRLMQAEGENEDLRKTLDAMVKEKAVLIARLKAAERSETELEFLQREVEKDKAEMERKDHQMMKLKARLYDVENPEEA